ncbi:hypothetical protein [Rudaea sp. 3F27F6]|nr:hypothetical protein [Rudaea sp. 3F27F6]
MTLFATAGCLLNVCSRSPETATATDSTSAEEPTAEGTADVY